ncbi:MAG: hypothetical protein ACSLFR_15255 [Solirubrobacteraceae bacterium]
MTERETPPITERELREAELQMTGRPPVATGFIGFHPVTPPNGASSPQPATENGSSSSGTNNSSDRK